MTGEAFHPQKRNLRFPTGWLHTDCVHYVACPTCHAPKDFHCASPNGKKSTTPHAARIEALKREWPEIAGDAR